MGLIVMLPCTIIQFLLFLFFSASLWRQEEKSQGKLLLHCWCSTENSQAEEQLSREDFFFLRAATLTKEYQMKVGWKTATKSPTGTGTSLCNINSHFLPTSQFKASFVAIACITQLYHTFIISHIKVKKTKGGVKYSGLIIQKTHCIVKRNNKRNEGLSFLCKNGKNTIIRFLRLCTRIECTM